MPKDELLNHNCIKHLRTVVQQQSTKIGELERTAAEHKHQLAEQVSQKQRAGKPGGWKHKDQRADSTSVQVCTLLSFQTHCVFVHIVRSGCLVHYLEHFFLFSLKYVMITDSKV